MSYLSLQIAEFDHIIVDYDQVSDACCGQIESDWTPESTHADDKNSGVQQFLLAFDFDIRQHDLSAVA
jgi:hypothetical protein